jgi:hypothetical protein
MKGCLLRLALLPLIVAAVYVLLSIREPFPTFVFPAEDAEVGAPVAGFFFWFAALYLLDARAARANLALLPQALTHGLRDGDKAVVYGVLEARGPLLEAPFTGEKCVGYEYKVSHRHPQLKGPQVDYHGHALTASALRGPMGSFSILAPADKEVFYEVPFELLRTDEAFARAESYLQSADFGEPGGLFRDVSRRETVEGPGSFRMDVKSGTQTELRSCHLEQKLLRPGDEVSVAGVYSEQERGVAPSPESIMKPFHIVPGGEAALARKIRSKRIGAIVCALLGLTIAAVYFLVVVPNLP